MALQFVVQIENRPGSLARFAHALAERGVNIVHCAAGGAGAIGYAIVETEDDAATREVLRSIGASFVEGRPMTVEVEDRPGALAEVAERLGTAGVEIHGLLIVGRRDGLVHLAITVDDEAAARAALERIPVTA
ncbi:MAG TPA: ACT domain-containing protein [Candidatus Limnocylindrales bacterium]|nr:ACT domain-containing protein [Candidatus Limnocylindrales bacterium]